jgi:hypothetical protein
VKLFYFSSSAFNIAFLFVIWVLSVLPDNSTFSFWQIVAEPFIGHRDLEITIEFLVKIRVRIARIAF